MIDTIRKKGSRRKRYVLVLNEQLQTMIDRLQEDRADEHMADTIRECIRIAYLKRWPVYIDKKSAPIQDERNQDEFGVQRQRHKVRMAETQKMVKHEMKLERQMNICTQLDGEITEKNTCRYFVYDERMRFEQEVPLTMLDEKLIETQYSPSRERVEELQEKGKVNYHVIPKKKEE